MNKCIAQPDLNMSYVRLSWLCSQNACDSFCWHSQMFKWEDNWWNYFYWWLFFFFFVSVNDEKDINFTAKTAKFSALFIYYVWLMNFKQPVKYILEITLRTLHGMFKILKVDQVWVCVHICVCVCEHTSHNRLPSMSCSLSTYCLLLYITLTAGTPAEAPSRRGLLGYLMWWTGIVWNPQTEVTSHWPHLVMTCMTPPPTYNP